MLKVFIGDDHELKQLGHPAIVRVVQGQERALASDVAQRGDEEWCDPEYSVALLEPHPEIPEGAHLYLEARSRSLKGREEQGGAWRFTLADEATAARFPEAEPETDHSPQACR